MESRELQVLTDDQTQKTLPKLSRKVDGVNRQDVVNAFQRAFEMIGGVNRLTLWANTNEAEFYRLYSRLLPSASLNIGMQVAPRIVHTLRPTALDNHPGQVIDLATGMIISENEGE